MSDPGLRIGRYLVSKVIVTKSLQPIFDSKVAPDWLDGADNQEALGWIIEYFNRYAEVPTSRIFKTQFPNFRLVRVDEPFDVYLDAVREARRRRLVYDMLLDARDELQENDDPAGALAAVQGYLAQIGTEITTLQDDNLQSNWKKRLAEWEAIMTNDQIVGIPTGFVTLDRLMGGILPEQLVTLVGLPKAGKSTFALLFAMAANMAGYSILFVSFEMSTYEQQARYDGFRAGINPRRLMQGRITPEDLDRLERALKAHAKKKLPPFIMSTDISATTTVTALGGKIKQYDPDLVIVDGAYMLENEVGADPGSEAAIRSISRSMKRLSQASKKSIVQTTQALNSRYSRAKGLKVDAVGYTSAFAQDSDVILGVERPEEDQPELARIRILEARNVPKIEFDVIMDFDKGQFEEVEGSGFEEDDDDDGKSKKD